MSLFFKEAKPLIQASENHGLSLEDYPLLPEKLSPFSPLIQNIKFNFKNPYQFIISIYKSIPRKDFKKLILLRHIHILFALLPPILIHQFLDLLSQQSQNHWIWFYACMLGVVNFLNGFTQQHYFYYLLGFNQIISNILNFAIYKKTMSLSHSASQKNQLGDIVNYMSSDAETISEMTDAFLTFYWSISLIIGSVAMLFYFIGSSAFMTILVMIVLFPFTKKVSHCFTQLDDDLKKLRDQRITLVSQILNAIRIVKYFVWEQSVVKEVENFRQQENQKRKKLAIYEAFVTLCFMGISIFAFFISMAHFVWSGGVLTTSLVFTCVSIFAILQEPFGELSVFISNIINTYVSVSRLIKYLNQEEKTTSFFGIENVAPEIQFKNLTFQYLDSNIVNLGPLNITIKAGESVAVVGSVGSGKSTLLHTLLGENSEAGTSGSLNFLNNGKIIFPKMSYVPQEAFIINGTLRDNITFGLIQNDFDELLNQALELSCLASDLKYFEMGLDTEIGEKGVNLSGGQKQRLSLARAIYSKAQLVFLDDPLSAVDVKTEGQLVKKLFNQHWKNHTVVCITHRLEHLIYFDKILFLKEGKVCSFGSFEELSESCILFKDFYSHHQNIKGDDSFLHVNTNININVNSNKQNFINEDINDDENIRPQLHNFKLTDKEEIHKGNISSDLFWDYLKSLASSENKNTYILRLFLLLGGSVAITWMPVMQRYWLSMVTNSIENKPLSVWSQKIFSFLQWEEVSNKPILAVYIFGFLGLLGLFFTLAIQLFWSYSGISAGQFMHKKMLNHVIKAPVHFFDATPVGRILQRFSRDLEAIEVQLQRSFDSFVSCMAQLLTTSILIITMIPSLLLVISPLVLYYYRIQKKYRGAARDAKRIDSLYRSPRYVHFKETILGLTTLRAYQCEKWFTQLFLEKLCISQKSFFGHYLINRWFSARIPVVGGIISGSTCLFAIYSVQHQILSSGNTALLVTFALSFWAYLNWAVRIFSDVESRMTSLERIQFYSNLPLEKDVIKPLKNSKQNLLNWPSEGTIEFRDVTARYAEQLPLVLRGVNFKIVGGRHVGIVGRTGSGKSTLLQSLYRFINIESGEILIDGIDIASVPLSHLRKSLAIIPQDPVMFMGTIRENMDRYNQYTDTQIWTVLTQVNLRTKIEYMNNGLNSFITESGLNLSQGERQLICLARALLSEAKIVVLDEATASIDVESDVKIQKIIREQFKNKTLLIIAHRLGTLKHVHQIIHLDQGHVVEPELVSWT